MIFTTNQSSFSVFMIVTAGWTQVEYRSMQMMPWVLMFKGPTPAAESVFLDYMSLLNVVSLYKSLQQKHFLVSLCVLGSLLLNGLSVISTGLFELDNRQIPRPTNFTVTHQFNASNWNPLASDALPFVACLGYTGQNLTPPIGVHDSYIYPPFQPVDSLISNSSNLEAGTEYEVDLDIFDVDLDCEPTKRTVNTTTRNEDDVSGGTIKGMDIFKTKDGCRLSTIPDVISLVNGGKNVDAFIQGCHGQTVPNPDVSESESQDISYGYDWRLWAMISPKMFDSDTQTEVMHSGAWQDIDITTIVCKMRYNMSHGKVTIWREPGSDTMSTSIKSKDLAPSKGLPNVSGNKFLFAVDQALTVGSTNFRLSNGEQSVFASAKPLDKLRKSPSDFTQAIKDSYSCLARQVAKNELLVQSPHQVQGMKRSEEPRLFVRPLSFWLMVALMTTLILAVILLLIFQLPVSVCPRDTSSIAGLSTVFAQSPEFMAAFQGTELKSIESMEGSELQKIQFSSHLEPDGTYRLVPGSEEPIQNRLIKSSDSHSMENLQISWWRPLSSTFYIQLPVVIAPLGVIAALETVYHISQSSHGITLVEGKSEYYHYVWTYIPALVMFAVRCLFQSIEFGARIFQPYVELRKGDASSETTVFENQLRKIAAFGVVDALRKRQWALAAATLTLLLAAITPIVVAGLYTVGHPMRTSSTNLIQLTRWDLGESTPWATYTQFWATGDYKTQTVPAMIIYMNLTYPQWTYKDLAFPQLLLNGTQNATQSGSSNATSQHGFVTARIPAVRPRLSCVEDKNLTCKGDAESGYDCSTNSCFSQDDAEGRLDEGFMVAYGGGGAHGVDLPPSNCPTYYILYGGNTARHHLIACNASIETVDVDVRFEVPSFSLDPEFEPKVVNESVKEPFRTSGAIWPELDKFDNYLAKAPPVTGSSTNSLDQSFASFMMEAMINGKGGVPLEELWDPATFMSRFSDIWVMCVTQIINTGARQSFEGAPNPTDAVWPNTTHAPVYQALYHDGRSYLIQSAISTRILDGILAGMILCALIAMVFMKTKRTLPKNPNSIAAVASMLQGSKMVETKYVQKRSEWCSDKELRRRGVFTTQRFSMGWWNMESKPPSTHPSDESRSNELEAQVRQKQFKIDFNMDEEIPDYRSPT